MNQITFAITLALFLASSVIGAPTESSPATADSTTTASTSAMTTTVPSSTAADQAKSAPATDDSSKESNTTSSMAVSSMHDQLLTNSSFTCYGRTIGYYGDVEHECKVYHFCLLGEYNGEAVYQRISYLCLNNTLFDQQALDCVDTAKMTAPCKESPNFYDLSNAILRQAIVGNVHQGSETEPKNATLAP